MKYKIVSKITGRRNKVTRLLEGYLNSNIEQVWYSEELDSLFVLNISDLVDFQVRNIAIFGQPLSLTYLSEL